MDKELKRLNRLIESNGKRLAIVQANQDGYLKRRAEIHNTQMLQMLTEFAVTPETLAELLKLSKTQSLPIHQPLLKGVPSHE